MPAVNSAHRLLLSLPFAVVAACSGGNSAEAPPPPTPGVEVTPDNAVDVANLTLRTAFAMADFAELAARFEKVLIPLPPEPPETPAPAVLTAVAEHPALQTVLAASLSTIVFGPEGGQVLYAWEDRDDDEVVTPGDSFVASFSGYGERGKLFQGIVTMEIVETFGLPRLNGWARGRMTFVDTSVSIDFVPLPFAGSVLFERERRPGVDLLHVDVDNGIQIEDGVLEPGSTLDVLYYPFFGEALFYSAAGSVTGDTLTGSVPFATDLAFNGYTFLPDPISGVMTMLGAGDAVIEANMLNASTLRIRTDVDGDGEFEESVDTVWPL